jgi:hypothetical protein
MEQLFTIMCLAWVILILGIVGTVWVGKKRWGPKGALLLPIIFCILYAIVLVLIYGEAWIFIFALPFVIGQ